MSWQLRAAIRGDLVRAMKADAEAGGRAVTTVIRRRTTVLKNAVRRQIAAAGLGVRLGNSARDQVFPARGFSMGAKGRVVSKAIYKRPGGLVDLFTVFEEGATVNALGGKYLVLQIGMGVQFGGASRAKSLYIDPKTMVMLPLRSGRGYLVVRRDPNRRVRDAHGNYGEPVALLVRQVTIRKRLHLDAAREYASQGIESQVAAEWERIAKRSGILA